MDMTRAVKAYTNLRDARSSLRKDFDAADAVLKENQTKIEAVMLDFLNSNGMSSVRTDAGTFYKQGDIKPACQDWSSFYDWIKEHDAFDALEKRVTKTFIKSYMDENEGSLPPGISVYREFAVRIRRNP